MYFHLFGLPNFLHITRILKSLYTLDVMVQPNMRSFLVYCLSFLICFQVKLRLALPSMLYPESGDGGASPVLKSIVGLNSPVTMDQCVFQLTLMARVVQILLSSSPDLPSKD